MKLSYRRDSARRRSLRCSRSFQVTNQKPVYDFLLVNNTNLHSISHRFSVVAQQRSTYRLWQGVHLVVGNLCEYRHVIYW